MIRIKDVTALIGGTVILDGAVELLLTLITNVITYVIINLIV